MARVSPHTARKARARTIPDGFDVTCVIGRVSFGDGDESPDMAAYRLISEHAAPGVYSFPSAFGGMTTVRIRTEADDVDNDDNMGA